MTNDWHAAVTKLSEGSRVRGTVSRRPSGEIALIWFAAEASFAVPAVWLAAILQRAEKEGA